MRTIAPTEASTETVVNRSRFICTLYRVASDAEARARISAHRKANWDATHNCTAYVVDDGQSARSNDDGEPAGTAGVPMLEVLRGRDLTDVLAVVTRHFGGVKLGAGGLVRAYGAAVAAALDAVGTVELARWQRLTVRVDYGLAGSLEGLLRLREDVRLVGVDFGAEVAFDLACSDVELLVDWLASQSAGAAEVEPAGTLRVEL
ncbi:IMPACT family protein [Glycomyces niveus]|uniref:YigZ family protein n=1 Tax=Glycomyces niveus TaxID=2820287 RepID=A0ABS3U0J6_9ACTN|nr:YigZ family protein [Glycomyces sp. NEAU-S30]MBO3732289.1 YigZ family protein [Glycomyces sp. NEAU-S30]